MADDSFVLYFQWGLLFLLLPTGQTTTFPPFQVCGAANYEVWNLTSKIWRFTVPQRFCLTPRADNLTADGCQITMAFCQSVSMPASCASSSVCESYLSNNDTYNLATYIPASNPFNTMALSSRKGFSTQYQGGETYTKADNTTCTLNTTMMFYCNAAATWDSAGTADVLTVPVEPSLQFTQGPQICTYNLAFDFAGACPVIAPVEPVTQLSAGSVLLLIFFASLIVYFGLGSFINLAQGRAGHSIIPHSHFWAALPVYIKDGIQFMLSCGGTRPSRPSYESI